MRGKRASRWLMLVGSILLGSLGYAAAPQRGWVTEVHPETQTIQVGARTVSTKGRQIVGTPLERGAFVAIDAQRIIVKPQRLPLDDRVSQFTGQTQPGRVGFSHLRHFHALGEGQCSACHASEGQLASRPALTPTVDPTQEAHADASLGRFCTRCHNGLTRLTQVGVLGHRPDRVIFTAFRTATSMSCQRCHVPKDHGDDFTLQHGSLAKQRGSASCLPCHSQDWQPEDRQRLSAFLAAEQPVLTPPEDTRPSLVVGPNNFCVYCHRADTAWQTP
ncbi:MAG: cytochrome c3 family protein [Candidatus Tectimicrobiota bacterium]